ncbi:hypothetical protein [Streptococcus pneumoniae]|uniref:hypothetical protein n=1 Tax=Streptococcus pneumoniae TaxID=1313 RepID=UPI0005E3AC57|nr:hypothetical protein [Streptococcus pneumoniae]CFE11657.1 Uncharacterised protein [Streptococcus pneumoniae]
MKIKGQTRKLAAGSQNTVLRLQIELTRFEEILEEYKLEIRLIVFISLSALQVI